MVKRILLAQGRMEVSQAPLQCGIDLAQRHEAELTIIPLLDTDYWKESFRQVLSGNEAARLAESQPWRVAQERADAARQQMVKRCEQAGIRYRLSLPEGQLVDYLVSQWRYHDLVVFGLRGLFDAGIVPDPEQTVADLILRGVRPIVAPSLTFRPPERVLIAYNGSTESAKAMKRFVQMRLWQNVSLTIACFGLPAAKAGHLLEDAAGYCHAHGYDAKTHRSEESAMRGLLPYAMQTNAQMIVIGNSYRNVIARSMLGDTMLHVTRQSTIPLFLSH